MLSLFVCEVYYPCTKNGISPDPVDNLALKKLK